jgi:SH3-like domain-containing protein
MGVPVDAGGSAVKLLRVPAILSAVLIAAVFLRAQDKKSVEREFPFSVTAVDAALKQLGAYTGARLPTLDGFITTERAQLPHYQRPYYEYKIDLKIAGQGRTLVEVKAKISAWYEDPQGAQSGYQALESNGRLEADLLDRLGEYLTTNQSTLLADPATLAGQIAAVRRQEAEAQQRIAELEKQLQQAQEDPHQSGAPKFAFVSHGRIAVLKAPDQHSAVLVHARAEDEFEVLERRGSWVRVSLQEGASGWVRNSEVSTAAAPAGSSSADMAGFLIIRRNVTPFSGEWARLKGKDAIYLWVRPVGSRFNASPAGRLRFAQAVFRERYLEAVHSSHPAFAGVVVIFLDSAGGVAAANLDDIGNWVDETIGQPEFWKRCSFDPRSEFFGSARESAAAADRKP